MKNLILISGPMGAGKTAVSNVLNEKLSNSVFLDGDWCWKMDPFIVNETNKLMVIKNIHYMLNSFLENPNFDNVVFCWVMDEQSIIDEVLSGLNLNDVKVISISLVPSEKKLSDNIKKDIKNGLRQPDSLNKAILRLKKYSKLSTIKCDNSQLNPNQVAVEIMKYVQYPTWH